MKNLLKLSTPFALLINTFFVGTTRPVSPYISIRPQGHNSALDMSGWSIQKPNDEESGDLTISSEYAQTFKNDGTTKALFGCYSSENCTTLSIKGSAITDRTKNDLLADWFYLAPNYQGTVSFNPRIQNSTTALNLSWLSNEIVPGLYISLKAPITWTRWNLQSVFFTSDEGTSSIATDTYLHDAEDFFCSKNADFDTTFTATRLSCAKFGCHDCDSTGAHSTTRLTDIQTNIGYNFSFENDAYTLGLFARLVIPTGNAPQGEWLFEPIAGNGKHWELGGGMNGGIRLWNTDDESKQCGFYGDITLTHLFGAHQNRVFDLKHKPLSRYMTAAHFIDGTVTEHAPLANLTSCAMDVRIGIQADIVALFNYTSHNWSFDLGYNLWARSCEKCNCSSKCSDCCGKCILKKGTETWGISTLGSTDTASLSTIVEKATTDATPVFITNTDIDYDGATTKNISNKIFMHLDYMWLDYTIIPHLGLGSEIEFGNTINCCSSQACCTNTAPTQWGVWIKGGASF